jgi:replication-associated recombination protein RarA
MNKLDLSAFVLTDKLEHQLKKIGTKPSLLPTFSVFFGEPGTGKTSIARLIGDVLAEECFYFPCNENGLGNKEFEEIENRMRTVSVLSQREKHFERLVIVDEFHNISRNKQDKFKTLYDRCPDDTRFIFVLNTDGTKGTRLGSVLSPPMISRCHPFSFDVPMDEGKMLVEKSMVKYPNLTETKVMAYLPDHRRLKRENDFACL